MSWRDLLQKDDERVTLPWIGGRTLQALDGRLWTLTRLPVEYGWYSFKTVGRKVNSFEETLPDTAVLGHVRTGYLVGNCLVVPDTQRKFRLQTIHLLERGLDRFSRVSAGSLTDDGPLVYQDQEMPLGPEEGVLNAYLNQETSVSGVSGVTPELEAAFWFETRHRQEQEQRRLELEAQREREERRREAERRVGTGQGRRELARLDFDSAARAALAVGGAEFLDTRDGFGTQKIVRFRIDGQRFECVCDLNLQIIDAGICLTAEYGDDDFERGVRGDTWFTLESLPAVIRGAINQNHLVVFRRA